MTEGLCAGCARPTKALKNGKHRKWCSRECQHRIQQRKTGRKLRAAGIIRRLKLSVICNVCGDPYHPKNSTRMTCCSRECGFKWISINSKGKSKKRIDPSRVREGKFSRVVFYDCRYCFNVSYKRGSRAPTYCSKTCSLFGLARRRARMAKPCMCECCKAQYSLLRIKNGSLYPNRHTCSLECSASLYTANRKRRKNIAKSTKDKVTGERLTREMIFERDLWVCQGCGIHTPRELIRSFKEPNAPTLDHITPLCRGGLHTWRNLQLLCRMCNSIKSDGTMDEYFVSYQRHTGRGRGLERNSQKTEPGVSHIHLQNLTFD